MSDDSDDSAKFLGVDFAKIFVIRMGNCLHYVSLTSNVKRAHKRKEGMRLCDKRLCEKGVFHTVVARKSL